MAQYQRFLGVAVDAARVAGQNIRSAFHKPKDVVHKGAVDLVTKTDQAAETIVRDKLKTAFPDHKFIGEEGSAAQGFTAELTHEPTWMVDPLDGTTNFVHSYPFVCVSIALAIDKQVVVGVVYNPILNELFTAVRGGGALLNEETPLRVSQQQELGKALLATEIGTTRDAETVAAIFDRIQTLTGCMRSVRCCGSCALNLCGVALGRLDAFYEIGFGGCWDVAAGALIVTEAGGYVADPTGLPFDVMSRRVLAANAHVGPQVAAILGKCKLSAHEPPPPSS